MEYIEIIPVGGICNNDCERGRARDHICPLKDTFFELLLTYLKYYDILISKGDVNNENRLY